MAFTYTLATLKDAVQEWLEEESDELSEAFGNIVNLAELQLLKDLPFTIFDETATGTLTSATLTKPTGYLEELNLFITVSAAQVLLTRKPWDYVQQYGGTGQPIYYAEASPTTMVVAPVPTSQAYTLRYIKRPTPLSETSGATTTWMSANVPDCMFAATLVAALNFLKTDDRLQIAKGAYDKAVSTALQENSNLMRTRYGQ